ncbi:unannotated protein [freshwater metagenome]|uniref:Unannotated protein n=1 Tax=freshwater metagenome TaxID=449393 RepID=A0A6J6TLV6_9ZZZZ|nr:hypothetical protein [Actinomycetota bacterium]
MTSQVPPTEPAPTSGARPAPLVVAASLAGVEGAALLLLAALEAASIESERLSLGLSTAIFFLLVGAAVLACASGLFRMASWSRGPLLLTQLIALGLAWNVQDLPLLAVALVLVALVTLAGMLHPDTMRALGALPEADPRER